MPYRLVYGGLAALAVAVIALTVALGPSGDPVAAPPPIEGFSPQPGDAVLPQNGIEVDLAVGYAAELFVDGFRIPSNELVFVEETGLMRWAPSPDSSYLSTWRPGTHTVRVVWDTSAGLPDPGEFSWSFTAR